MFDFLFVHIASSMRAAACGDSTRTCENFAMKASDILTGSGNEKEANLGAFFNRERGRGWKCVRTLTKFPIKDLTFFASLRPKLKIRIKNRNKKGKI